MDSITLVIGLSFGGLILMVILGFYLLIHRSSSSNTTGSSSAYETRDYYAQYGPRKAQESKYSYESSRRPFRSDAEIEANARRVRQNARAIMIVILVVAVVAVIIAGLFTDPLIFILLVFLIPIALSFLSPRRVRNSPDDQDSNRRS
jgi:Flp pilus assembly protein TadB